MLRKSRQQVGTGVYDGQRKALSRLSASESLVVTGSCSREADHPV